MPVFTNRGSRLLDFGANHKSIAGFIVPLPANPGESHRQWSGWLPTAENGGATPPHQFT
jgi:hypothetical protein